jgi:hypothetical protein
MMSAEMQRVYKIAEATLETMDCTHMWARSVEIIHEEGTCFNFKNAFAIKFYDKNHENWGQCHCPGEWLFIFTEHHGIHIYPIDDLYYFNQTINLKIENHESYPADHWKCNECNSEFIEPLIFEEQQGKSFCPSCGFDNIHVLSKRI